MITLYIKTHRVTGLKYFGKTIKDDPIAYKGSGKYWRRHLMKHGYDCDTEIYFQTENEKEAIFEALRFSRAYDIVNSDLWANLIEENGLDGAPGGYPRHDISKGKKGKNRPPFSDEWKENLSKARKGLPLNKKHCQRISEALEKKWIVTDPCGNEWSIVNLMKFCRENSLDQGSMSNVASGKHKQHKDGSVKNWSLSHDMPKNGGYHMIGTTSSGTLLICIDARPYHVPVPLVQGELYTLRGYTVGATGYCAALLVEVQAPQIFRVLMGIDGEDGFYRCRFRRFNIHKSFTDMLETANNKQLFMRGLKMKLYFIQMDRLKFEVF